MEIIKQKSKLNEFVNETLTQYATVGERVHVAVVSAIYHAAATGYVETLTKIYNGLRSNDQTAMRQYIRRAHVILGLGGDVDPDDVHNVEVIKAAHDAGKVLDFKNKEFVIAEGRGHTSAQAKALAKLATENLIKPDGKLHKMVLERNNFQQAQVLGDNDVLKAILRALKMPESTGDRREVHVSDKVAKLISKVRPEVEGLLEQTERQDEQTKEGHAAGTQAA